MSSQEVADHLRAQVAPTAIVLRDRTWQDLPRRELVPGEIIRLSAGDLVPVDARLLEARDLHVQQAALTGESIPAEKEAVEDARSVSSHGWQHGHPRPSLTGACAPLASSSCVPSCSSYSL
jgi:P-type Mg2+ transporter